MVRRRFKYKRTYVVHTGTLMNCMMSSNTSLKTYLFYLNLHSLYEKKAIHNWKQQITRLAFETGVARTTFHKYLKILFEAGLAFEDKSNSLHLSIGGLSKVVEYFGSDVYHNGTKPHQSHKTKIYKDTPLTLLDLKCEFLKSMSCRKRRQFVRGLLNDKEFKSKSKNVRREVLNERLMASRIPNIHLFLNEIAKAMGGKTKQAASKMISDLKKSNHISVKQNYIQLGKHNNMLPKGFRENGIFVKGEWKIQQTANAITFNSHYETKKNWYDKPIDNYVDLLIKKKASRCLQTKLRNENHVSSKLEYINSLDPLEYSKKLFYKVVLNYKTGEVFKESYYYHIKGLTKQSEQKIWLTEFDWKKSKDLVSLEIPIGNLDLKKEYNLEENLSEFSIAKDNIIEQKDSINKIIKKKYDFMNRYCKCRM